MNTEECQGRCRDFFVTNHGALGVEHEVVPDGSIPRTFVYIAGVGEAIRFEADIVDMLALHAGTLEAGDAVRLHPPLR